ncbi:MAG: hypothetical protein ABWX94_01505 [Candidatus Saccharimonadales bacterium]
MVKRSKYKKGSIARVVYSGLAAIFIAIYGVIGFSPLLMSASAQDAKPPAQSQFCEEANGQFVPSDKPCIAKEIIKCTPGVAGDPCADPALNASCKSISCNALIKDYVEPGIKALTGLMGVVVAASIIVAGIQYGSAGSDPGKVAAAKKRLTSAILALLSYFFMFAFLQWLLPGGVL